MSSDTNPRRCEGEKPLQAYTLNEARYYLVVTPCGQCLKGPWEVDAVESDQTPGLLSIESHCGNCRARRLFAFSCRRPQPADGPEALQINPTDQPSRIVDLGQWLSLFYMLIESAASERDRRTARRTGYRAAMCLAEALKFYADDDEPPASAFFYDRTAEARRRHPESFSRQRLRDMQAKLPDSGAMARRIRRDERRKGHPWWRFWR
ncbi:MAG TPA: hypothetical protein VNA25_14865 [Phycisphaerae bacterium]|nr:hypothetical protein [Phycisphaerae bacterium]